jgi:hypothetical protein
MGVARLRGEHLRVEAVGVGELARLMVRTAAANASAGVSDHH